MQTQRLYSGFQPASVMPSGRYSPQAYASVEQMRRHYISSGSANLFGTLDEGIFQARAEAALVAMGDIKAPQCHLALDGVIKAENLGHSYQRLGVSQPRMESEFLGGMAMANGSDGATMTLADHHHHMATMASMAANHHHPQFAQYSSHPVINCHSSGVNSGYASLSATTPTVQPTPQSTVGESSESSSDPRELELFAEHFKQRRIKLGITQADVGRALGNLKLPGVGSLSQSTICRFESLTLSHNNMTALRPILTSWLEQAEAANKGRRRDDSATMLAGGDKKRKRTSIGAQEKRSLEAFFQVQPRPSGEKIAAIAEKLDLRKNVVRVWFCNQRQKQKRCRNRNLPSSDKGQTSNWS